MNNKNVYNFPQNLWLFQQKRNSRNLKQNPCKNIPFNQKMILKDSSISTNSLPALKKVSGHDNRNEFCSSTSQSSSFSIDDILKKSFTDVGNDLTKVNLRFKSKKAENQNWVRRDKTDPNWLVLGRKSTQNQTHQLDMSQEENKFQLTGNSHIFEFGVKSVLTGNSNPASGENDV